MRTPIGEFDCEWLLGRQNLLNPTDANMARIIHNTISIPGGSGQGEFTRLILPAGMAYSTAEAIFEQTETPKLIVFDPVNIVYNENALFIQAAQGQTVDVTDKVTGQQLVYGGGRLHVRHQQSMELVGKFYNHLSLKIYTTGIPRTAAVASIGEEFVEKILAAFGLSEPNNGDAIKVPFHIESILHNIYESEFNESLRLVMAQAKIIQFLTMLVEYSLTVRNQVQKKFEVRDLYDLLNKAKDEFPSLLELSDLMGVNVRLMNEEFKNTYGLSITQFMIERRLDQAHWALEHSKLPIKVLADRVGYKHVSNFTAAFVKKYGYTPGSLRKR